jgi:hypothetical protein
MKTMMNYTPDELLAASLDKVAKPANLFRFRVDKETKKLVVLDFGYLPPIIDTDPLEEGVCKVHTRIEIDFNLAKEMAQILLKTIDSVL